MKINVNRAGLVMAEALLTVTMLAIAAIILSEVFQSSMTMTALSKNYLIGQNLAVEGVEIVKQIRNTNWLVEPNDKTCWLTLDPSLDCNGEALVDRNYLAFATENGAYKLVEDDAGTLYIDSLKRFTAVKGENAASNFGRLIKFTQITDNNATVEVTVSWNEGQKVNKITVTEVITNSL